MSDRPFLIFTSRDEEARPVLKIQGSGIPLTERPLDLPFCLYLISQLVDVAEELAKLPPPASQNQASGREHS